jgi:putative ABC transport system permease protein
LVLMWRLVLRDVRRRPGEALVHLLVVTVACASLTLGAAAGGAVSTGYAKTRAATAGPDVMGSTTSADPAGLAARLGRLPGVTAVGGPFYAYDSTLRAPGGSANAAVVARDPAVRSAVDRPLVTSGTWVRPGGAVLQRGFAQALGIRVGDRITVGGRGVRVVGTAVSAAMGVYPWSNPAQGPGPTDYGGVVWLTPADARAASGGALAVHLLYLKLADPAAAHSFSRSAAVRAARGDDWASFHSWQDVLRTDNAMIRSTRPTLVVGGWLLAVAAVVTLASLATVRAAREHRRAALLKAVGAGPGTVTAVLLAQYLLLTLLAAALGLAAGTFAAPRLVDPSAGLVDTVSAPAARTVVVALLLGAVVAVAGAFGPAVRAARTSTVRALADPAHPPTRHPRLNAATAYLPTALLLGVRLLARRPGRAAVAAAGAAATTVMVTALLAFRAELAAEPAFIRSGPLHLRDDQVGRVLLGVTLAMLALSTLNTLLLGWSGAVQARRTLTVARTLGATPGQVTAALCVAQVLAAVPGVAAGVPVGLGLYWFFGTETVPPGWWLLGAGAAVVAGAAALTALPAWLHARGPAGRPLAAG